MTCPLSKPVRASAIYDYIYKIFPDDLNALNTIFGGKIMAILDRLALVVAERHSGETCVTAAVDALHFLRPARQGDTLIFQASINRSWTSSMEIGVRVLTENFRSGERAHLVSAYFTFVAVDEVGKRVSVPAVQPETPEEQRRYEEANLRRVQRKQAAEARRQRRQSG